MILHKHHLSPYTNKSLEKCLIYAGNEDAILLTQDAVYALLRKDVSKLHSYVYVLNDDALARGIDIPAWATSINYQQMVELTLEYENIISW